MCRHMVHIGVSFLVSVDADPRFAVHHSVAFAPGKAECTDFGDDGARAVCGRRKRRMDGAKCSQSCCSRVLPSWMLGKNSKNNVSHMQAWEP